MSKSLYVGYCITICRVVSLQRYIFQSNRMKENIGASFLVKYWLERGLIDSLKAADFTVATNACLSDSNASPLLMQEKVDINFVYIGGGNAAFLCQSKEMAHKAVSVWSRALIENAPGLRTVVGHSWVETSLKDAYCEALQQLDDASQSLPFGAMLYGLPVAKTCTSTGFPASVQENDDWISLAAACKRKHVEAAQKDIAQEFDSVLNTQQSFATQLEELGGRRGQSHIAVIHADGNEMGQWLNDVMKGSSSDDEFLTYIRAFSSSVKELANTALTKTLQHLQDALPLQPLKTKEQIFPVRPIVYGGDDLTFICDGRIGLDLAAFYLQEFSKGTINVCGQEKKVTACAGIAIVPTKFPFARAYGFASELCNLAKSYRRKKGHDGCWLDFQIVSEGATGSITDLRRMQYQSLEGQTLHQRPYQVPGSWDIFIHILRAFRTSEWPRNRAKALLRALVQGPAVTQQLVESVQWRGAKLPCVSEMDANERRIGWTGGDATERNTHFFDPLEALDFYLEVKAGDPVNHIVDSNVVENDRE